MERGGLRIETRRLSFGKFGFAASALGASSLAV